MFNINLDDIKAIAGESCNTVAYPTVSKEQLQELFVCEALQYMSRRDLDPAAKDHAQQSLALATIIHERIAEGAPDAQLVPLVAGLAELQPWVEQWHSELDPTFGVSPAQFAREQLSEHLKSLGLTVDDLAAWRPPAPTRGRRAAK